MLNKAFCFLIFVFCFLLSVSFADNIVVPFTQVPNQPYFQSAQLMADSAENNTIILTLKSNRRGTARLFWANHYDPQFNQPKSLWFFIKPGLHDYVFNVSSQNQNWIGWIKALLIMPEFPLSDFEVREAKIVPGSFSTDIASGWQEFWGPNGRIVVGSTINLMSSSAVYGRSINIYLYWLVGISTLFFLLVRSVRSTMIILLACWTFLAFNSAYNFVNLFKDDFTKYFGKTIEQKRSVAYGQELYDFLVFAKKSLPAKPVEFQIVSSTYSPDLQGRIYLLPHIYSYSFDRKPDYLLVYKPSLEQLAKVKGFSLVARLNDNAYIVKRNK